MEMQSAESALIKTPKALARSRKESGRIYDWPLSHRRGICRDAGFSYALLSREAEPGSMLSPPQIALLLIANLVPAIALMVLMHARSRERVLSRGESARGSFIQGWSHYSRWIAAVADGDCRHLRFTAPAVGP